MSRAVRRTAGAAAVALALWGGVQIVYNTVLCPPHRVWETYNDGEAVVIVDRGERQLRVQDALFVCEIPHRAGPLVLHQDLNCYCAPASMTVEQVAARVGGTCDEERQFASGRSCGGRFCNRYVSP